jgi:DNA processing protein
MLNELFGSPKTLWESQDRDITKYQTILGEKATKSILDYKNEKYLEKAASILSNPDICVVTLDDEQYPVLLKSIFDPPAVLYCKGLPLNNDITYIAVVGSRKTSEYGRQMADRFAYDLSLAGMGIVSGAARGIDTMAHKGALRADGYTIAVLGCGVDIAYPGDNRKLFTQIKEHGTLVSEYPPGTYPAPSNFPARNRIISGISKAVLVVEAGERSGALITVDFALEQGRDVYVLPGNINNPYCAGTNRLLKEGARLVTDTSEIIEESITEKTQVLQKYEKPKSVQLDLFETEVYNALDDGEKHIEDLAFTTGFHIGKLNAIITMLEIKGMVKQLPGNIFIRR